MISSIKVGTFEDTLTQVSSREMSKGGAFAFNQFGEDRQIGLKREFLGKGFIFNTRHLKRIKIYRILEKLL